MRKLWTNSIAMLLCVVMLFSLSVSLAAASPEDQLEWMPTELQESVTAYLPFEDSYQDVEGELTPVYYNKTDKKEYTTEESAESGAKFIDGKRGRAISFGDGQYYAQGESSNVNLGQLDVDKSFTISMWANGMFSAPYENYQVLFGNSDWQNCDDDTKGQGILLSMLKDGNIGGTDVPNAYVMNVKAGSEKRASGDRQSAGSDADIVNDWHLITVTADREQGVYTMYLDGKKLSAEHYSASVDKSIQNTSPMRIGSDGYSGFGYYGGVDDLILFDKSLSAREVSILAQAYDLPVEAMPLELGSSITDNEDGTYTVKVSLTNLGIVDHTDISLKLETLGDGSIEGEAKKSVPEVADGKTESVEWKVSVNSGSVKLFLTCEENGDTTTRRIGAAKSGIAGWVSGDSHDHSKYSDGSGTIAENFASAEMQGIDYVNICDHSNSNGWDDAQKAGEKNDVIAIRGNEYSGAQYTHSVFINVNQEKNYSNMTPYDAVKEFKKDTTGTGLAYAAHPYDGRANGAYDPKTGWDSWSNAWETDLDGIEVWNGWYAGNYCVNAEARVKWDELNKQGRHLYGIATTDTHSARYIGEVYTTVYAEEINTDGILAAHKAGHMYGSNGPVIDFTIGNAMMGDDLPVAKAGEKVTVNLSANYIQPLSRVLLLKNGEVIKTWDVNDACDFKESFEVDVAPSDFLRMEVEGTETETRKLDGATFDTSAPFAFSNPIFFTEKQSSGGSSSGSSLTRYPITVKQSEGGTISPSTARVERGGSQTFTIKANEGYSIADILVDGKSMGAVATYTFEKISAAHTITAVFKKTAETSTPAAGFVDVKESDWFAEAVKYVVDAKLMNGTSAATFSPEGNTTRGMIVTILYRMAGSPTVDFSEFTDVPADRFYAEAVAWAASNEIVTGYGDGTFRPEENITREQMAAILYRYAQKQGYAVAKGAELSGYADAAQISSYALPAMQWANAEGLINGTSASTLMPGGFATRAQVSAILMQFCETTAK